MAKPKSKKKPAPAFAPAPPLVRRPDIRRWIYAALDVVFALIYFVVTAFVLETRFAFDRAQLLTLPIFAAMMAAGSLFGGQIGWRISVAGCGLLLATVVVLIVRILISSAYLAAVFGGFGQMATGIALIAAALIIEVAALLPLFQLKYLMSRAGRRAFGLTAPLTVHAG